MVTSPVELNMDAAPRLSSASLASLHAIVARPTYDRERTGTGQVHLGVGAFMRAHIAAYNDAVMNASGGDWAIAGVSLRRPNVRDRLQPQDGLYTVAVCDGKDEDYRLVGSIKSVDVAPEDPQKIIRLIANPAISVVSLTVTEKGYSIEPESGALDIGSAGIGHDLANPDTPQSTLGFLAAALRQRRDDGAGPITLMSCDNLPHNGARLRAALREFVELAKPDHLQWLDDNCRFPATMVDRIVPAITAADIEQAASKIGVSDAALVRTEPFSQWAIENDFAAARPGWENAGALLVENVEPYELAKLRLLNGPHSTIAYLGYLGGYRFVHEVMRNSHYAAFLRYLMEQEISPATPQPEGMQHADYIEDLLARFKNEALNHRTWQIAMDGSQKLPQRLLNTVREQLDEDGSIAGLALAIAGWIRYTQGQDEQGARIDVSDPLADRFAAIRAQSSGEPEDIVERYLGIAEVFGTDLPARARFRTAVTDRLRQLLQKGAARTVADFVDGC